ncbi:MAG: hypothetical protein JWQ74_2299 [Marmoricola sp.]|nr:hypothetical protein [Marmoricola sp.]
MTRRLVFRTLVLLLVLAAWVTTVVAPAAIADADDSLQVSSDGSHWAASLGRPLFDPAVLWVPGDRRTSSFFVANRGSTPAAVSVQVVTGADDGLVAPGDVELEARVAGEGWRPVTHAVGSAALNALAIPIDQARRVDVRAFFRTGSHNVSQASAVTLRFVVQLGDAITLLPQQPVALLPGTGAPLLGLPLLVALLSLVTGVAVVRRTGERRG